MMCKCGYNFVQASLDALRAKQEQPYTSYMLVNDKNYKKFLRSEIKAVEAKNIKDDRLEMRHLCKSATFTGSAIICPECSRLVINLPEGDATPEGTLYFKKESAKKRKKKPK